MYINNDCMEWQKKNKNYFLIDLGNKWFRMNKKIIIKLSWLNFNIISIYLSLRNIKIKKHIGLHDSNKLYINRDFLLIYLAYLYK